MLTRTRIDRSFRLGALLMVLPALVVAGVCGQCFAVPATNPATQPSVIYDKFQDSTVVSIDLSGITVGYVFSGRHQTSSIEQFFVVTSDATIRGRTLIFLIDGEQRLRLPLESSEITKVNADWLSQLATAKTLEYNGGKGIDGTRLSGTEIERLRSLLALAGYYSDQARLWNPGKRTAFILDTTGSMVGRFDRVTELIESHLTQDANPDRKFNLLTASEFTSQLGNQWLPFDAASITKAKGFLRRVVVHGSGGDAMADAFSAAKRLGADSIVFLTDGDLEESEYSSIAKVVDGTHIVLNVIVVSSRGSQGCRGLAAKTGGRYRVVSDTP